jgi:NAD+ kinase
MNVLLVVHPGREGAVEAARRAVVAVRAAGHVVRVAASPPSATSSLPSDLPVAELSAAGAASLEAEELIIAFGGDGTFLRAARLARDPGVAVIGVNTGRLGFLASIEPDELEAALAELLALRYDTEPRATLDAKVFDADGSEQATLWALNEVAVEKVARQRLLRLDVAIGGTPFADVAADAVIVATSTGSTAYALSAGGPIVSPSLDAMLVVPVAPHSLFDRTVVAGPGDTVTITVADDQDGALVSTDGLVPILVRPGGWVEVRGGGRPVNVARIGPSDFYGRVRRKFRLG